MDGYQTFMSRKVCVNSTSLLFTFQYGNFSTPTRTHSISKLSLEINIFDLKMIMKRGLESFILKFTKPLKSCCSPVQKDLPRKAELAWQISRYL